MATEIKNEGTVNNQEEQQNVTPDGNVIETKKHPVKDFFRKHGGKIKTGLGIAGAVGVGIAVDKLGLSRLGKKASDTDASTDE